MRAGDFQLSAHRQHHRRKFRRRIGKSDAATQRAAIADGWMRHVRRRLAQERRIARDQRIGERLAMARQCADPQPIALQFDAAKRRNMARYR